jgi:hypothetical protein
MRSACHNVNIFAVAYNYEKILEAGLAHWVQLWYRRPGFDSGQVKDFCFLRNVQAGSGAHPACCP